MLLGVPKFGTEASFVVQSLYNDKSILGCRYGLPAAPRHPAVRRPYKAGKLKLDGWCPRRSSPSRSKRRSTPCTRGSTAVLNFAD